MADNSKEDFLQLIKRVGAFLTVKISNLLRHLVYFFFSVLFSFSFICWFPFGFQLIVMHFLCFFGHFCDFSHFHILGICYLWGMIGTFLSCWKMGLRVQLSIRIFLIFFCLFASWAMKLFCSIKNLMKLLWVVVWLYEKLGFFFFVFFGKKKGMAK